ncbi:MAG: CoA transferase [Sphingomonadales bacterium]|nr:CoA transferase [Sphingomonadales bacterium]MBU3991637.1 CoA transferase [Alphaproteobacteria bacterium]
MSKTASATSNPVSGPLDGVKVLDMSRILAAPWTAQLLADMGAEVIKVERPGLGDDSRRLTPYSKLPDGSRGESTFYLSANRGKRSITIDISKPEGQELIRKLAAQSDVLIENYKVGDLKRYGLDYESLSKINPRLIYCSVTGFGQTGPYAPRPGYDNIFQAMSGIMSVTGAPAGEKGEGPTKIGNSMSDMLAGLFAAVGICAALRDQTTEGKGRYIDVALLDSSFASLSHLIQWYLSLNEIPPRRGAEGNGGMPAGLFRCADGKDLVITAGNDAQWLRLAEAIGVMHLTTEERFKTVANRSDNRRQLMPLLDDVLITRPLAHWLELLDKAGVPAGPVNNIADVLEDENAEIRGLTVTVPHPQFPELKTVASPIKFADMAEDAVPLPPPLLGEHTDLILREVLQLAPAEIAALKDKKVV